MFGEKRREEKREAEALAEAKAQAAAAVEDSETDDASFEPDEALEQQEEPDSGDIRK
ncbi:MULTISPECIES: hypothetical protein [Microbacterium]|uniref:Uncharacterized protein n=1 Tax=Microbacterium azadirachtae TaxID=582680 RepID=A0A0F0LPP7_9MICO|nr:MULTISPECIES: hypothetical protein [Microbacterium]KJL35172.1 hypothetical protein RS86_00555 [Microbacterium azadirachtae]